LTLEQLTNEVKRGGGGDTKTSQARQEIARREEQIVALRLRHNSFTAIGRVVGVSKQAAQKAFLRALHRNTDADIQTHHRSELAELEAEAAKLWNIIDVKDQTARNITSALNTMNRIHIRRAKLLGLDAPTKLDVGAFYARGTSQLSEERLARQAVLAALPREEQERIYDMFAAARKRAAGGAIETAATPAISGPVSRNDPESESDTER
jgi:hypothetical protein